MDKDGDGTVDATEVRAGPRVPFLCNYLLADRDQRAVLQPE
jgi:hypothetical protein